MKTCSNCYKVIRNNDKYCRNCGMKILKPYQIVLINIIKVILTIMFIMMIITFIVSYFV